MGKAIDLTGNSYGKLRVIKRVENKGTQTCWLCTCECGNKIVVQGGNLKNNHTTSCGCYRKQKIIEAKTTHGDRKTRLYTIWQNMKDRCTNSNNKDYKNYGERGIRVHTQWINSYETFKDWAFKNGYNDDLTIDRIDNNGNYEPLNCQWATRKQQCNNRRNSINIEHNGKIQTLAQWCEELNLNYKTVFIKLKNGCSVEKTFET